jgi:hypothetical protein
MQEDEVMSMTWLTGQWRRSTAVHLWPQSRQSQKFRRTRKGAFRLMRYKHLTNEISTRKRKHILTSRIANGLGDVLGNSRPPVRPRVKLPEVAQNCQSP